MNKCVKLNRPNLTGNWERYLYPSSGIIWEFHIGTQGYVLSAYNLKARDYYSGSTDEELTEVERIYKRVTAEEG
jgi:hypothetical protein